MGWDIATKKVVRTNEVGVQTGNDVWQQDQQNSVKIIAQRHDVHDQDLADAISETLNINGINAMKANLDMGGYDFTNLPAAPATGKSGDDISTMAFNDTTRILTITKKDATTLTATIPGGEGGGGTGTVESISIGDGLSSTANPITVTGTLSLETIGVAQTFSGGIASVTVDKHGRVTQVVTGSSPNTNLALGTRSASAMEVTSSTGTNVSLPLVDKSQSYAGLMSPTDKTNLDNLVGSSGITEIIAGQAIQVTANSTERTVAALQGTTTQIGVLELATTTEATTGTDTTRAVTPAGVKAVVDAIGSMSSDPAKWDFTNSGTSMYLRYEGAQLAQIPVASAGAYDGLLSSADKTSLNNLISNALTSLVAGTNVTITGSGNSRTISSTDTNTVTTISTGTGLDGSGSGSVTITLDLAELSTATPVGTDEIVFLDAGNEKKVDFDDVPLTLFNTSVNLTCTSFNATSARWLKEEIGPYVPFDIMRVPRPIRYRMKDAVDGREHIGYFADDMLGYCPEAVTIDDEGRPAGIDYSRLVVPLLEKVKELEERLSALEA